MPNPSLLYSLAVISLGASSGAILRWLLDVSMNAMFPNLPLGTLTANLVGAYLIGIAMAMFASLPDLSPEWRLLIITGFLGGLTTFSSFSAQVVGLIQQEKLSWAAIAVGAHVAGSLLLTMLGIATVALTKKVL